MRRIAATVAVMLAILCGSASAAARTGVYAEYSPPPRNGSLFTVDIFCDSHISAAEFRLDYDTALVAYRSVEAERASSAVKARADGTGVSVVFCDSEGISGRLCRLTLKWAGEGDAGFTLSMTGAVDDGLNRLSDPPAYSFSASFAGGAEDDGSGSSRTGSSGRSYSATRATGSGSRSTKTYLNDDYGDEATGSEQRVLRDLSRPRDAEYFLIGAGSAAAAGLFILLGFLAGRRIKNKKPSDNSESPDPDGSDDEPGEIAEDINNIIDE